MPKVSVIIPTHNRPELLKRAVASVERQTYRDFEIIVVEDRDSKGGGWARNQGIRRAHGEFIAFLDDDDEWMPEKLEVQMRALEPTSRKVGFCFSAVTTVYNDHRERTTVPEGVGDYFELALVRFKSFLNVTLVVKRHVLDDIGYFDEALPSHQETDLVIRMSKKYQGLGINMPLVDVNMREHERIGGDMLRKITGREMILKKYHNEFAQRPRVLAHHLFQLGLWYRDLGRFAEAREIFFSAWCKNHRLRYLAHYFMMTYK